jgi:ribosomal protein L22
VATPETQTVRAQAKWVRTSARKARLVAEHIRGRPVAEARAVLAFTPRAAAREMEKVLQSAVANAEANHGLLGRDLVVSAAYVDEGPTLKRWRARARGRVARIRKRTCHITVLLEPAAPTATAGRRPRRGAAAATTPEVPAAKPRTRRPPVRRPKAEAATETPAATEEKPKRRTPVRRKKTEEGES